MSEEDAKKLVRDAIASGVFNDLGSGSNIDLCVIKKGSVDYLRGYEYANKKGVRSVSGFHGFHHACIFFRCFFFHQRFCISSLLNNSSTTTLKLAQQLFLKHPLNAMWLRRLLSQFHRHPVKLHQWTPPSFNQPSYRI